MISYNSTVIQFINGRCTNVQISAEHESDHIFTQIVSNTAVVLSRNDPFTARMIPECADALTPDQVSDGNSPLTFLDLTFLDNIELGIYKPNIGDIELCYFDQLGMPEYILNYYESVTVIDGDNFISILEIAFPEIKFYH